MDTNKLKGYGLDLNMPGSAKKGIELIAEGMLEERADEKKGYEPRAIGLWLMSQAEAFEGALNSMRGEDIGPGKSVQAAANAYGFLLGVMVQCSSKDGHVQDCIDDVADSIKQVMENVCEQVTCMDGDGKARPNLERKMSEAVQEVVGFRPPDATIH